MEQFVGAHTKNNLIENFTEKYPYSSELTIIKLCTHVINITICHNATKKKPT